MLRRILIATLMATSLSALCWEANVDYIYWKAAGSDLPWVSIAGPANQLSPHEFTSVLRSDYTSGIRLQVEAGIWDCWSLSGRYLWLESVDRVHFTRPEGFLIEVIGQVAPITSAPTSGALATQSLPIHIAELFASRPVTAGCWGSLDFLAGVTYLYARRSFVGRYINPPTALPATQARNRFSGAGPLLGLRAVHHTFSWIDLTTELDLMTVIGEVSNSVITSPPFSAEVANFKTTTTGCVGGVLRLGCQVHHNRFGICLLGDLGWEHRLYAQVTSVGSRNSFFVTGGGEDDFVIRNLFVGGPYIGIGAKF